MSLSNEEIVAVKTGRMKDRKKLFMIPNKRVFFTAFGYARPHNKLLLYIP